MLGLTACPHPPSCHLENAAPLCGLKQLLGTPTSHPPEGKANDPSRDHPVSISLLCQWTVGTRESPHATEEAFSVPKVPALTPGFAGPPDCRTWVLLAPVQVLWGSAGERRKGHRHEPGKKPAGDGQGEAAAPKRAQHQCSRTASLAPWKTQPHTARGTNPARNKGPVTMVISAARKHSPVPPAGCDSSGRADRREEMGKAPPALPGGDSAEPPPPVTQPGGSS